jgi:ABC-type hemin transport system substrate-binding protein
MKSRVLCCFLLLFSCGKSEDEQVAGERVISLSPSITATLEDVGVSDLVVGRSSFCKAVDSNIPVVGDLYEIDYERLLLLQPTKVFVQETASGVDAHLKQLSEREQFSLHSWEVNRLDDIKKMHDELVDILGVDAEPMQLSLGEVDNSLPAPMLIMTSGSPGSLGICFGKQTYLDDVLTLIGGTNVLATPGWVSLSLEDIVELNPAAIIMVSDTSISISKSINSLDIPIIQCIHEDVLIPSSKIIDVAHTFKDKLLQR